MTGIAQSPTGAGAHGRYLRLRGLPRGALAALLLIVVCEGMLRSIEREAFTTNSAASWRQTGRAAGREARRADVLCFGDSMIKFGVSPGVIEATTGLRGYNLAPYGGPPAASALLLERALESGAKPKAIVVDFMPHLLAVAPRHHMRLWQELIDPGNALELASASRDASFFAECLAGRYLTSFRARHEIRTNLKHAFKGESYNAVIAHFVTPLWRNWRVNRGAELAPVTPPFDGQARPWDQALFPTDWHPDPASADAMRRFLDLAAQRSIPVLWLIPPLSPATQELREHQGHDAFYSRLVRSVQERYANVLVVDARHAGFGDELFLDPVHLNRDGAIELSLRLGRILRELTAGGEDDGAATPSVAWVSLPPASLPPVMPEVEDLDQSRLVLQAIEQHVRR